MKAVNIGIDVGNGDTKSSNVTLSSGFTTSVATPYKAKNYVYWNGKYYISDGSRFAYVEDKTKDDKCIILSLLALSAELLNIVEKKLSVKNKGEDNTTREKQLIQAELDKCSVINLGVGLPPNHYSYLKDALEQYYKNYLGEGISYEFAGYKISFKLGICKVFPQGYAAIATYRPKDENSFLLKAKTYYSVDIGAYTVDIIPIENGKPNAQKSDSIELGVLKMYAEIKRRVKKDYGITLEDENIKTILNNEYSILDDDVQKFILDMVEEWFNNIINTLREKGIKFESYPIVFLGGGSQLFKRWIKKNTLIKKYEIIPGSNSNAEGYKQMIAMIAKRAS